MAPTMVIRPTGTAKAASSANQSSSQPGRAISLSRCSGSRWSRHRQPSSPGKATHPAHRPHLRNSCLGNPKPY